MHILCIWDMRILFVLVIIRFWIVGHGFVFIKGKMNDFIALDKSASVPFFVIKRRCPHPVRADHKGILGSAAAY